MKRNSSVRYGFTSDKQGKGISGSTLKIIAIITMFLDHSAATIINKMLQIKGLDKIDPNDFERMKDFFAQNSSLIFSYGAFRIIGRLAFPIFCFLLIEGFQHTSNRWKYALRLFIFALISEIPFDLAFYNTFFEKSHQNVFFTLLIGLMVLQAFSLIDEKGKEKNWLPILAVAGAIAAGCTLTYTFSGIIKYEYSVLIIIAALLSLIMVILYLILSKRNQKWSIYFADILVLAVGMILAQILQTDYAGFGVLTIVIMYYFRNSYVKSVLAGAITLCFISIIELAALFNIFFVRAYKGERGLNLKYEFYFFYPLHLLALYLICYFI
jgi:hypothetical protein